MQLICKGAQPFKAAGKNHFMSLSSDFIRQSATLVAWRLWCWLLRLLAQGWLPEQCPFRVDLASEAGKSDHEILAMLSFESCVVHRAKLHELIRGEVVTLLDANASDKGVIHEAGSFDAHLCAP